MKISRIERKDFLDVHVWNTKVVLRFRKDQTYDPVGAVHAEIRLSKKETTQLIKALKTQRARKGVR